MTHIVNFMLFLIGSVYIEVKSFISKYSLLFSKNQVHFSKKYNQQHILIYSIYQKDNLRLDSLNVIKTAKALGLFIIMVNTSRLLPSSVSEIKDFVDIYVERPNFGYDFGSYKYAINLINNDKKYMVSKKIIILNDSVFSFSKTLNQTFQDLLNVKYNVVGVTENLEIEHHIASYCMSFDNTVMNNQLFIKFWKNFKPKNNRRYNINSGELMLSKMLFNSVALNKINILYNGESILNSIVKDPNLCYKIPLIACQSDSPLIPWHKINADEIIELSKLNFNYNDRDFILRHQSLSDSKQTIQSTHTMDDALLQIKSKIDGEDIRLADATKHAYLGYLINRVTSGSQIHQNAALFFKLGCPFIKLDLNYRGIDDGKVFSYISSNLPDDESKLLKKLIYARGRGDLTLRGLNLILFRFGFK